MMKPLLEIVWYGLVILGIFCVLSTPDDSSPTWVSDICRSQAIGWCALVTARYIRRFTSFRYKEKANNKTISYQKRCPLREERSHAKVV